MGESQGRDRHKTASKRKTLQTEHQSEKEEEEEKLFFLTWDLSPPTKKGVNNVGGSFVCGQSFSMGWWWWEERRRRQKDK